MPPAARACHACVGLQCALRPALPATALTEGCLQESAVASAYDGSNMVIAFDTAPGSAVKVGAAPAGDLLQSTIAMATCFFSLPDATKADLLRSLSSASLRFHRTSRLPASKPSLPARTTPAPWWRTASSHGSPRPPARPRCACGHYMDIVVCIHHVRFYVLHFASQYRIFHNIRLALPLQSGVPSQWLGCPPTLCSLAV